ncbi:TPA: FAD-dependent oxidoreductase [Pseudomonas aeruginosa]|nr:FAD-dependent oxidoreductase [Pseudomonas aeruginosa]HEP9306371.1 FAD-dependent oxidoreductase [Pseudomonas aeruginosa]
MSTNSARIVIVGAGLSGLYAALLLEQKGIRDYVILEARHNLGGRILSMPSLTSVDSTSANTSNPNDIFDLGPSWFWPGFQPQLDSLVRELGLERFEQFEDGNMVIEQSLNHLPVATPGYVNSPPSMRLVGGMNALISAIHLRLDGAKILTGTVVNCIRRAGPLVEVACECRGGQATSWTAEHVLLALPPRLVVNSIEFFPPLPEDLSSSWKSTATWMAPHAKYFAIYEKPFWRNRGLSGEGRSRFGPMGEIHDASIPGGNAALFGFVGVPARMRKSIPDTQMRALCRAQLVRMYGEPARMPLMEFFKDWALDPFTATESDWEGAGEHAAAPAATADTGPWSGQIIGIGSEWSPQFPGYIAGAIESASRGVQSIRALAVKERNPSVTLRPR